MKKIRMILSLIVIFSLFIPSFGFTHSGRTDSNGGHYDRKTGGYHYHGGGNTKSVSPNQNGGSTQTRDADTLIQSQERNNQQNQIETTVYITRTGKKYHRDDCRYLKSKIPISKQDAVERGFTPCSVCSP